MLSPEAEIEALRAAVARQFSVYGVVVSPMALTFQVGVPPGGVDAPFDALRLELVPKDYIPTITQEKGETLVHIQRRPRPRFARTQVNLILLLVTVLTTTFFGGAWNWADYSGKQFLSAESIGFGSLFFTVPLLTILGSHEMGHYLVAKRYKVQASLPFFLPSVPPLGTFGAFISMRDPIPNRRALLDIGVSGPLVGFAIAIPVTLAGLALSAASPANGLTLAGQAQPSLLFRALSLFFPLPDVLIAHPHPLAFAGWVGLFVTAINLLPAGQLDGGHVARALFGKNQFYVSWAAVLTLFALTVFPPPGYPGWFLFGFLILVLGVRHPPPLNDLTRLDSRRKLIGIAAVVILIVTFVPQPFVTVASERGLAFQATDGTPLPINQSIALGASILLTFGVNNTGPVKESVIVTAYDPNLNAFGFVILFTSYQIGSMVTPVNDSSVTISLNSTQVAAFDLRVTAPSVWPTPLPRYVAFVVVARTIDGSVSAQLPVDLQVIP